jgi:hypothetical protein
MAQNSLWGGGIIYHMYMDEQIMDEKLKRIKG